MNAFNEDRHDETDGVSSMLNELPRVDPPTTLVGTVMSSITQFAQTHATQPPVNFMRRSNTMAKKVLWTVAAAAAAALVVMRVAGYPPVDKGTEATIGAAQRYQAPQVAAGDVKVEDHELQAFLQSDLFRQLAADKAAMAALKNKEFQKALSSPEVRAALAQPQVQQVIAYVRFDAANLNAAQVQIDAAALATAGVRIDAAALASAEAALQAAANASPVLAQALAAPQVAQAIAASSLATALAAPTAALALAQPAAVNALMAAAPTAAIDAAGAAQAGGAIGQ
jgi:hypothetical protein